MTSIEHHYVHSLRGCNEMHKMDIEMLKRAIKECSPDYANTAEQVLKGKSAHMLNLFIMSSELFDAYCSWLFPVIDKTVEYNLQRKNQKRYAGALSEFCLDIWMKKNHIKYKEVCLLETEKVSFFKKVVNRISKQVFGS